MARPKRGAAVEKKNTEKEPEDIPTAIYVRKSFDDRDSLENQIDMLKNYIEESKGLKLFMVYEDNGYTGTNFDRPGFTQMLADMKLGKFRAILVKDSSRLGRNYIETGDFIENVCPEYGIRFIAVNDHYDSMDDQADRDNILLPLKNIMNEQYSKDLSRKLSSTFRIKQLAGEYIGPYGPYGYQKDPNNHHQLVIDPNTAPVVVTIFERKSTGIGNSSIAEWLNGQGVLSPFAYRHSMGLVKAEKYRDMLWKSSSIRGILSNQMYLGHMVQGVHGGSIAKKEKKHRKDAKEWIVIPHTHEPIISQELFDRVQKIMNKGDS